MNTIIEMWQTGVTWLCVAALVLVVPVLAAGFLWRYCRGIFAYLFDAMLGVPFMLRVFALVTLGKLMAYGPPAPCADISIDETEWPSCAAGEPIYWEF